MLDKLPKSKQPEARLMLHDIYQADTKKNAEKAFERFVEVFDDKYPRAVKSLSTNRDRLL